MYELPTFPKRSALTPRQLEVAACLIQACQQRNGARVKPFAANS